MISLVIFFVLLYFYSQLLVGALWSAHKVKPQSCLICQQACSSNQEASCFCHGGSSGGTGGPTTCRSNASFRASSHGDRATNEASPDLSLIAKLSNCPRSLHELWKEYEFGSGGFKAAKDFTERERGADKSKYYSRNVF